MGMSSSQEHQTPVGGSEGEGEGIHIFKRAFSLLCREQYEGGKSGHPASGKKVTVSQGRGGVGDSGNGKKWISLRDNQEVKSTGRGGRFSVGRQESAGVTAECQPGFCFVQLDARGASRGEIHRNGGWRGRGTTIHWLGARALGYEHELVAPQETGGGDEITASLRSSS